MLSQLSASGCAGLPESSLVAYANNITLIKKKFDSLLYFNEELFLRFRSASGGGRPASTQRCRIHPRNVVGYVKW